MFLTHCIGLCNTIIAKITFFDNYLYKAYDNGPPVWSFRNQCGPGEIFAIPARTRAGPRLWKLPFRFHATMKPG